MTPQERLESLLETVFVPNDPEVKDCELVAEEDRMSYGLQ